MLFSRWGHQLLPRGARARGIAAVRHLGLAGDPTFADVLDRASVILGQPFEVVEFPEFEGKGIAATLLPDRTSHVVLLNPRVAGAHREWTICHELGHALLADLALGSQACLRQPKASSARMRAATLRTEHAAELFALEVVTRVTLPSSRAARLESVFA